MLTLALYKTDKEGFLNIGKQSSHIDKELFLKSINLNAIGDYKAIIIFLNDLVSIKFFQYTTYILCPFSLECFHPENEGEYNTLFLEQAIDILAKAYNDNQNEYKDFINSFSIKNSDSALFEPWLYVLANFLPGFIETRTSEDLFYYFGSKFFISTEKGYNGNPGKYSAELITLNPVFATYAIKGMSQGQLNDNDRVQVLEAISKIESIPIQLRLSCKLELTKNIMGEHNFYNNDKLYISNKHSILKHKDFYKKALVIYGYDHNGAFKGYDTELNLFLNGYDVLVIDARDKVIAKNDIAELIKDAGYNDLSKIYINMHGANAFIVTDTLLTLNDHFSSEHAHITASSLFKIIVKELNGQPIKAIISSCHSQLLTHKIANILPQESEIVTLSEDQEINGYRYSFEFYESFYKNVNKLFGIEENIRSVIAKEEYYQNYSNITLADINSKLPSSTYVKLGYCNFRTSVNFSQKDLKELLSKVSKEEASSEVAAYLGAEIEDFIKEDVYKFFDLFESSTNAMPLLDYREDTSANSSFHKYLGVASAIYGVYDQCGNGYISDGDFIPNEDNFFAKITLDTVLNSSPLISNYIIWAAGKVIEYVESF